MLSTGVSGPFRLSALLRARGEVRWRGAERAFSANHEKQQTSDPRNAIVLKDVTIVDGVSDAVHAVKRLMELGRRRNVAWSPQIVRNSNGTDINTQFTISAYAGKDVDFGNGSHLFIRNDSEAEGEKIWKLLKRYFEDEVGTKVWFNYPSMRRVFAHRGIQPAGFGADLVSMAGLTSESLKQETLDGLAATFLKQSEVSKCESLLKKNAISVKSAGRRPWDSSTHLLAQSDWIARGCVDAALTYALFEKLSEVLKSTEIAGLSSTPDFQIEFGNLHEVYEYFFSPLVTQLYGMQTHGMSVNRDVLSAQTRRGQDEKQALEARFLKWACEFSPDAAFMDMRSSKQLRQLLFAPCKNMNVKTKTLPAKDSFPLKKKKGEKNENDRHKQNIGHEKKEFVLRGKGAEVKVSTKAGWPSVSTAALRKAAGFPRAEKPSFGQRDHAFCYAVDDLLASKLLKDNAESDAPGVMSEQMVESDDRVRLTHRIDSKTGQLVSSAIDKEMVSVRKALDAAPGNALLLGQVKEMELSMLAHLSGCDALRMRLEHGPNKHEMSMMALFDHVREAVHEGKCVVESMARIGRSGLQTIANAFPDECSQSKLLDLGMARGGSVKVIRELLGVKSGKAEELMRRWYGEHPGVQEWRERCVQFAKTEGYLETLLGRRRLTKNVDGAHWQQRDAACAAAVGFAVSGSCGEALMGAIVNLGNDEALAALGWKIVFVKGDYVVLEGPQYSVDIAKPVLERVLREPMDFDLDVIFEVEVRAGESLAEIEGSDALLRGEGAVNANAPVVQKLY